MLVFGHHHPWDPSLDRAQRDVLRHQPRRQRSAVRGHRARARRSRAISRGTRTATRTRRFDAARDVPIVEIACVKDYPGAWAEYRVYEGGYVQLVAAYRHARRDGVDREDARDVRGPLSRLRARELERPLLRAIFSGLVVIDPLAAVRRSTFARSNSKLRGGIALRRRNIAIMVTAHCADRAGRVRQQLASRAASGRRHDDHDGARRRVPHVTIDAQGLRVHAAGVDPRARST